MLLCHGKEAQVWNLIFIFVVYESIFQLANIRAWRRGCEQRWCWMKQTRRPWWRQWEKICIQVNSLTYVVEIFDYFTCAAVALNMTLWNYHLSQCHKNRRMMHILRRDWSAPTRIARSETMKWYPLQRRCMILRWNQIWVKRRRKVIR